MNNIKEYISEQINTRIEEFVRTNKYYCPIYDILSFFDNQVPDKYDYIVKQAQSNNNWISVENCNTYIYDNIPDNYILNNGCVYFYLNKNDLDIISSGNKIEDCFIYSKRNGIECFLDIPDDKYNFVIAKTNGKYYKTSTGYVIMRNIFWTSVYIKENNKWIKLSERF